MRPPQSLDGVGNPPEPAPSKPAAVPVRFRVIRTSWAEPPCPEAYRGTYTEHHYCTLPLAEAMRSPRTEWFRRLANHRAAPGGSVADKPDTAAWFVDISDLDALEAFIRNHGRIVVDWQSDGPSIEIYDDYRE